ncbi:MAG: AAA family ATPase, partial [Planctomycetes bacterium]|nr:AAA family ATPase [Planctomycetota bacterium]
MSDPAPYRIFARKYRPRTFAEVIGQDHIVRALSGAFEHQRIAQSYLLSGPRGVGKTTTARIIAKSLNCEAGPTIMPCLECDACHE